MKSSSSCGGLEGKSRPTGGFSMETGEKIEDQRNREIWFEIEIEIEIEITSCSSSSCRMEFGCIRFGAALLR